MHIFGSGNLFISAYAESDWFGKGIFCALFLLSILSWTVLIYKGWLFSKMKRLAFEFIPLFSEKDPLNLPFTGVGKGRFLEAPHPFFEVYKAVKQKTLQMIGRNHFFSPNAAAPVYLSEADLNLIETQSHAIVAVQMKILEKNLFVLSTIVTLGPFLGLLGTVWGILLTFKGGFSANNTVMLSGLSMALATTVIGLLVAIPALVGYNYLKNGVREMARDLENFSDLLLSSVELQYRKPEYAKEVPSEI